MKIIVYSTPTCPYCTKIKSYLDSKGYKYEEKDVTDPENRSEMLEKSDGKTTIPFICIGDDCFQTSDPEEFEKHHTT